MEALLILICGLFYAPRQRQQPFADDALPWRKLDQCMRLTSCQGMTPAAQVMDLWRKGSSGFPSAYTIKPMSRSFSWSRMLRPSNTNAGFTCVAPIMRLVVG